MPLSAEAAQCVKNILDAATSGGSESANGLVFIAADRSGATLVEHASGKRSIDGDEPMDMDTCFWLASCTKIVAAIAIMQLVEQGQIPLDDADFIARVAPEIAAKKVYMDGVNGVDQERGVTMRMLLTHTAGFGYPIFDERIRKWGRPAGIDVFSGDWEDMLKSPLVNQPGTKWQYGVSLDLAGLILERVTSLPLNTYMQRHIFAPLGVSDCTMFPAPSTVQTNFAALHQRDPATRELSVRNHLMHRALTQRTEEQQKTFCNSAGGGLFGRPREFVQVLVALANGGVSPTTGERILKEKTVEEMWQNQIPEQPDFGREGMTSYEPLLSNHLQMLYPQANDPPQGYGMSFALTIAPGDTGRGANTAFWSGLANLFWWCDREKGVVGMLAGQILPFGDPTVGQTWFATEKAVYDGLVQGPP